MTYELAPSTVLLATHCAICGRPLRDAVSVETGVGPDCREKHGYAEAQGAADWAAIERFSASLDEADFAAVTGAWGDAHKTANVITHRAACVDRSARGPLVVVLGLLGYSKLAAAVAKGAGEVVRIRRAGDRYTVVAPFNEAFTAALKDARIGARWDRTIDTGAKRPGAWTVPTDARARAGLFEVLKSTFAGAMLVSEKGITQIPA